MGVTIIHTPFGLKPGLCMLLRAVQKPTRPGEMGGKLKPADIQSSTKSHSLWKQYEIFLVIPCHDRSLWDPGGLHVTQHPLSNANSRLPSPLPAIYPTVRPNQLTLFVTETDALASKSIETVLLPSLEAHSSEFSPLCAVQCLTREAMRRGIERAPQLIAEGSK